MCTPIDSSRSRLVRCSTRPLSAPAPLPTRATPSSSLKEGAGVLDAEHVAERVEHGRRHLAELAGLGEPVCRAHADAPAARLGKTVCGPIAFGQKFGDSEAHDCRIGVFPPLDNIPCTATMADTPQKALPMDSETVRPTAQPVVALPCASRRARGLGAHRMVSIRARRMFVDMCNLR